MSKQDLLRCIREFREEQYEKWDKSTTLITFIYILLVKYDENEHLDKEDLKKLLLETLDNFL